MLCGAAVFFLALLIGVVGFRLVNPLRMFFNMPVPGFSLASKPSTKEAGRYQAVNVGAGKIALFGILIGFVGLFVVCCGARDLPPDQIPPAGPPTHAPESPSR
jgi:hypothetical protein